MLWSVDRWPLSKLWCSGSSWAGRCCGAVKSEFFGQLPSQTSLPEGCLHRLCS